MALPEAHDRMLYFGVSTYFFNTAGLVYYTAGALTYAITDDMIPKDIQLRLNTTSMAALIPQLKLLYPNMAMKLRVSPSSAPALAITPEMLSLQPLVDVQAFAILPNSTLAPLFIIGVSTTISAQVSVNATKIYGSLKLGRMMMSLKHSDVGPFSVQLMEALINFSAAGILMPQVNARLAEGFPLPLPDDVQLSSVFLRLQQGFLLFGADVRYG
ncbi:Bactericidal permeability-increasing protein [Varanus komodoensis]|nr:Bactericidal permeability-increasing protein [Varanus komodoensis]